MKAWSPRVRVGNIGRDLGRDHKVLRSGILVLLVDILNKTKLDLLRELEETLILSLP